MTTKEIQDQLIKCFTQKRGCRVIRREGEPIDLVANSLGIFHIENGFTGMTSDQKTHEVKLADVERIEIT